VSVERFPADSTFPHLEIAGNPETMRGVFEEHLRSVGEGNYRVTDCRVSRVRYRKGKRCVLQYTLRLAEPDTGFERIQWVTGVMYAEDVTRRKWEKLRLVDPGKIPDVFSTFEPFAYLPALGMLVEVFPYDRKLPTLPLVMAGPSPELEPSILAHFGPGDWHTEAWNVEPIRYRAELAATLRITVQARDETTGRTDERRFYAKVHHDDDGVRTYHALQALWNRAGGNDEFTVGRPVAYLDGLRTLLQEESPGTPLQDLILREEDARPAVRAAATALAALHLSRVPTPRLHRLPNEVAMLERTGRLLLWARPNLGAKIEKIVGAVIASLKEVPTAPTHRDLKPDHILLDNDRPTLIDFDAFAEADPVLDVAHILAHLAGMRFRFPHLQEDRWRTAMQTFAEEYFAHVPNAWRDRLPVHYAGSTVKVAVGFFRRQEPDWPNKIATLLEEAEESLLTRNW
jgi:hypothetical protein